MDDTVIAATSTASSFPIARTVREDLAVGGMTCAHCPPEVERALVALKEVVAARANLANKIAAIDDDRNRARIIVL